MLQRRLHEKSSPLRLERVHRGHMRIECDRGIELELMPKNAASESRAQRIMRRRRRPLRPAAASDIRPATATWIPALRSATNPPSTTHTECNRSIPISAGASTRSGGPQKPLPQLT